MRPRPGARARALHARAGKVRASLEDSVLDGSSQKTSSSSMDGTRVCGGRTSRPPPNPHASENTPEAAQRGYLRLLNDG